MRNILLIAATGCLVPSARIRSSPKSEPLLGEVLKLAQRQRRP